jgi:hypothetical protein
MPVHKRVFLSATLAAALLTSVAAFADDPPLRVGRISYVEGNVSFHAADEDNWSFATLNYPVVSGNAFWTDPDGRSEIQVGSVEIRMDHSTEMEALQLDETATRLDVPQGVVNIHFSTPPVNGSVEVMTPSGPIELTRPGTYHIDAGQPVQGGPPQPVQVTALEGQLEIRSQRALLEVMPGETAILNGNPPAFSLAEAAPTPFDDWALARERREEAHLAAQYVSAHTTGYEDLDYYGQWSNDASYGTVWYPTVVESGWAPYRYGHWAYVAPWGWTWVDSAPWGFAPFHYGRWAMINNRWGWVPGQVVERPVYAPALVAFIGGNGWSVSLSLGGATPAVGWVPLAPREVFYPYYATSVDYVRNVNYTSVNRTVVNNITVNNIRNVTVTNYVNQRAATVVPNEAFRQGQPVHKSLIQVSGEQMSRAPMTPSLAHLAPAQAAREEGRPMQPSSAQSQILHAPLVKRAEPVEQPAAAPAPHPQPQAQHNAQQQPEERRMEEPHPAGGAPSPHSVAMNGEHAVPAHAPGPPIHRPAPEEVQQKITRFAPAEKHEPLPNAQVPHPVQHAPITPTPQGWQRREEAPHPAPQPHEAPHPGSQQENRRQENER